MISTATLYMGGIRPLPPDNKPSGIFKSEIVMPAWLGKEGLGGDAQADRRVHGGPDKALHQYPVAHYARLAAAFPEAGNLLVPGSIGENLSAPGWDESNVCIGDTFRLGDALVQVSQPRSPCWKIDHRYGVDGMARLIDDAGITGWYFRVIEEGSVEPGCAFQLINRMTPEVTVQALLAAWQEHRPEPKELERLAAIPGLSENWRRKLLDRSVRLKSLQDTGLDRSIPSPGNAFQLCHARLLLDSYRSLLKRDLFDLPAGNIGHALYAAPMVVLAHDTAADPVFFYGNLAAQQLFEMGWEELVQLPSRFSAEPVAREERQRLLELVTRQGYIDNYSGIRIARSGKRFLIERATVWNLLGRDGQVLGQAAAFDRWMPIA